MLVIHQEKCVQRQTRWRPFQGFIIEYFTAHDPSYIGGSFARFIDEFLLTPWTPADSQRSARNCPLVPDSPRFASTSSAPARTRTGGRTEYGGGLYGFADSGRPTIGRIAGVVPVVSPVGGDAAGSPHRCGSGR